MSDTARFFQPTEPTLVQSEETLRAQFFQRMQLAKKYAGYTNREIARRCRASESSVSTWFDARNRTLPEATKMIQLPWALGVNGHWLLTGEGQMVSATNGHQNEGAREAIARTQAFLDEMRVEVGKPHTAEDGNRREDGRDRREA